VVGVRGIYRSYWRRRSCPGVGFRRSWWWRSVPGSGYTRICSTNASAGKSASTRCCSTTAGRRRPGRPGAAFGLEPDGTLDAGHYALAV
jgi:hypothetical protein